MKERRLPIVPTLAAVYRDWRRLLFPLRTIIISAFLIVLAVAVVTELVPHRLWDRELSGAALGLAEDAVRAFLLTPIIIAINRFIVLGETAPRYGLDVSEPAFWHLFAWLLALKVIAGLPYELLGVLQARGFSLWPTTLVLAIALIVAVAVFAAADRPVSGHCRRDAGRDRAQRVRRHQGPGSAAASDLFPGVAAVVRSRRGRCHFARARRGHHRLGAGDRRPRGGRHRADRRHFALGRHRVARIHVPCRPCQKRCALKSRIPRSKKAQ